MRSPWDDFAKHVLSDMLVETPQLFVNPDWMLSQRTRLVMVLASDV